MDPLLCFPDPLPAELALALTKAGYDYRCVARPELADAEDAPGEDGWPGAVVSATGDLNGALVLCRLLRKREVPLSPLLLVVTAAQIGDLELRDELYDDFCVHPAAPDEVAARLAHLFWRSGRGIRPELIEYGALQLNLETYQAAVSGRVLDLTYMEYELLRFLAAHPAKVFTRETLLSRVWGYEYYGGARTVDVHVRRLRAKLGEEHAHLIQTVRSVGYRFGQIGWVPSMARTERDNRAVGG
ncbi:MAG TPA: response regulator transcription factor [Acidimicrobiales bacterium]|nr:response regulator transcription factor [Acidimicrobiales bacterium]